MKFLKFFILLCVIVLASAAPSSDESGREGRVTCDILGFFGDSACKAHCDLIAWTLSRPKRGGYCNSKRICVCR